MSDKCREAFEAWAISIGETEAELAKDSDGDYLWFELSAMWTSWQAAYHSRDAEIAEVISYLEWAMDHLGNDEDAMVLANLYDAIVKLKGVAG